jgi:ribosomal protein L24E
MQMFSKCPFCGQVNEHGATKVIEVRVDEVRRFMCEQHVARLLALPREGTKDAPELQEVA